MAVIKKSELKSMSLKEIEKKIEELEKVVLELKGEGKREKVKPVQKTIARLKTLALRFK